MEAIKQIDLASLTPLELETVSNYVLYGKDDDQYSCVDKKYVQIKTKYQSYQKDKVLSLDEMMENPAFDETQFVENNIYKTTKQKIEPEQLQSIPGLADLKQEIDKWEQLYLEEKDEQKRYHMKHFLIQLKKQQYCLIGNYYPTRQHKPNYLNYFQWYGDSQLNYPVLPRGLMKEEHDIDFLVPRNSRNTIDAIVDDETLEQWRRTNKHYFDFRDVKHLYLLFQAYDDIVEQIRLQPDSPLWNLVWTFDFYIEQANLSQQQLLIVDMKKHKMPNRDIAVRLEAELGIKHSDNYISTIFNKAVKLIADAVELDYDSYLCRNYDKAWKTCKCCGRALLRDSRNFVKKQRAVDGLTSRCKKCDKEMRRQGGLENG